MLKRAIPVTRLRFLAILVLVGCGDGAGPSSELAPGTTQYTATRIGQSLPPDQFKGTATFDARTLPNSVVLELSANLGATNYQMLLYHYGTAPITERTYPIAGDQAVVTADSVFYVHGSHVIRGDARTTGTLTITRFDAQTINADFDYIGPVDSAGVEWYVEIKGKVSARHDP